MALRVVGAGLGRTGTMSWHAMAEAVFAARFTTAVNDPAVAVAAFERHNARVRETVPAHRLIEWRAGDGWAPLCAALGVPVPDEPFPHTNTREYWLAGNSSELGTEIVRGRVGESALTLASAPWRPCCRWGRRC